MVYANENAHPRRLEVVIFKDFDGYWFVEKQHKEAAKADPARYRTVIHPTKIAACRSALELARSQQATILHCLGVGGATKITEEAKRFGIVALAGVPTIDTDLTRNRPGKKS